MSKDIAKVTANVNIYVKIDNNIGHILFNLDFVLTDRMPHYTMECRT